MTDNFFTSVIDGIKTDVNSPGLLEFGVEFQKRSLFQCLHYRDLNEPRVQESVVESIHVEGAKTVKIATGKRYRRNHKPKETLLFS